MSERLAPPAGRAKRRQNAQKRFSELILDSNLSKGRRTASFERCRNQELRTSEMYKNGVGIHAMMHARSRRYLAQTNNHKHERINP